jgi:WD40 repeat protein
MALSVLPGLLAGCASLQEGEAPSVIKQRAHSGGSAIAISQSGDLAASGGWEGTLRLWRLPEGSEVRHWQAHADSVNGIAFVDDDRQVVSAGYDGVLARRSVNGALLQQTTTPAPVTHMVADTATDQLLTGHSDGSVRLWQLGDFELLRSYPAHRGQVRAVAIAPGGARFASSSADGSVAILTAGGEVQQLEAPPADAWTLAFSPEGDELTGGSWFRLYRWQLDDGSLKTIPTEHLGIIKAIEYIDGGRELATISRQTDSAVYFLDAQSGEVKRRFQRHDLCGGDITVSADGRYLATTSDDASVRFWLLEGDSEKKK